MLLLVLLVPVAFAQDNNWRDALTPQDEIDFPALADEPQSIEDTAPSPDLPSAKETHNYSKPEQRDTADEEEPLSTIEEMYGARLDEAPRQFGYEIFENISDATPTPIGAVQDSYILGIDDAVSVSFSGQRNTREIVRVDTQGMVTVQDFPPVAAAGLSLAQLRAALEERALGLHNTQIYVTLAEMRQIGVLVVGNVKKPGRKNLTVFNTVLDALIMSEGVRKDGSLRHIKLVRGGESRMIDLYDLLLQGGSKSEDITLRDGDRVVVPPIGATVAVAGAVKRPGIFEIRTDPFKGVMGKNTSRLTLHRMLELGGGVLGAGQNRFMSLSVKENGYEVVEQVNVEGDALFGDGSILLVSRGKELRSAKIELLGQTRKPGLYALAQQKSLSSVLNDPQVLGEDIYPLIGVISRWDHDSLTTKFIEYPVRAVLKKQKDIDLRDGDKIYLFSNADIQKIFSPQKNESSGIDNEGFGAKKTGEDLSKNTALVSILKERAVVVRGAVRQPGFYPVADGVTLDDLLAAAGGLGRDADNANIEITTTKTSGTSQAASKRKSVDLGQKGAGAHPVRPGDAVRVMQKYRHMEEKGVLISGQVKNPGRYDLLPEDKVSDLIRRAGGLSMQAYPDGAVFSRESERRAEESRFKAAKQDMERSLAAALQREKNPPDAAQIEMVRSLASELGNAKALGRITIESDPQVLEMQPELDMLLEEGDRLFIPKRPLLVRVSGEVLSPASLQFVQDKDALTYIQQAGGFTYHADKDRAFVLFPDGSAETLRVNTWNHKPSKIPPGSTIVVPRDPKPFDFIESARDITQIISNLAVTSILVDDLQE